MRSTVHLYDYCILLFQRLIISVAIIGRLFPQEISIKLVETSWFFQALAMANLFHSVGMLRAYPTLFVPYRLPHATSEDDDFPKLPPNGGICDDFFGGCGVE